MADPYLEFKANERGRAPSAQRTDGVNCSPKRRIGIIVSALTPRLRKRWAMQFAGDRERGSRFVGHGAYEMLAAAVAR